MLATAGYLTLMQWLLNLEAEKDEAQFSGANALHGAASNGHLEVVRLLLGSGADKNRDFRETTMKALLLAACNCHLEVVQFLLKDGADKNRDFRETSMTALLLAACNGHWEVGRLLLKAGAEKHREADKNREMETYNFHETIIALLPAARHGNWCVVWKVVQMLWNRTAA